MISPKAEVEITSNLSIGRESIISSFTKVKSVEGPLTIGRNVEISTDDPTHDLLALTGWAAGRGAGRLDGLTVTRPTLEDIYLALTSDTEEAA